MAMFKRIFFFLALNAAVMITLMTVTHLLGIRPYLSAYGIDYTSLMLFCLVWGMGGAFISLGLSRMMAKWMMGVKVIDPNTRDPELQQLLSMVHRLARGAGMTTMPEVGIYNSPEVNAFATGPTKARSLVAVSTGLLNSMDSRSVEGVLGHEVAHIANGDMVTMTLLQGVVNAFVMFLARILAFAVSNFIRKDDEEGGGLSYGIQYMLVFVFEIVFMILGSLIVAWFSRYREYRADAGGARLAGRENMISALQSLQRLSQRNEAVPETAPAIASLKISHQGKSWMHLFSTHPPLEERVKRLQLATRL